MVHPPLEKVWRRREPCNSDGVDLDGRRIHRGGKGKELEAQIKGVEKELAMERIEKRIEELSTKIDGMKRFLQAIAAQRAR